MFQFLQSHLKKIFGFLLVFIIPSFCLYFVGGTGKTSEVVGKLYGKKVTHTELENSYKAAYLEAALMYGAYFKNIAPYLNLEKNAWERLMLLYKANREKISVTPEEVKESILEFFKKISGQEQFDNQAYKYFVNSNLNMELGAFEKMMADSLKIKKLRDEVSKDISVSDDEVKEYYLAENNKLQISYVKLASEDFVDKITVDEEELIKTFSENRNMFTLKEKVALKYLFISPRDYEAKVDLSDSVIKAYYEDNKDDYLLAEEKEEVTSDEPDLDDEGAVEADLNENTYKPLEEVKEDIKKLIIKKESELMADEFADKIYREMVEEENFQGIVEKYNIPLQETEMFTKENPPSVIGDPASSQVRDAFEIGINDFAGPYNHLNGWLLISVKEKQVPRVPEKLAEVKDRVEEYVKALKAPELAKEEAAKLQPKIKALLDTKTFEEAVKQIGLKVHTSGMINNKTVFVRGIGNQKEIVEKAFQLKENELSEVLSLNNSKDCIIMQVTRRSDANMDNFADAKDSTAERALAEKKKNYYAEWMKELEKESDWQIRMPDTEQQKSN